MAGKGLRTKKYGSFKQLIEIEGKTILEWFLLGLKDNFEPYDDFSFITLNEYDMDYKLFDKIFEIFDKLKIKFEHENITVTTIPELLNGPAQTIKEVDFDELNLELPAIVANSDQFIKFNIPEIKKTDGFATIYYTDNPKSSFVEITDQLITGFREKAMISNYASSGVYGFGTTQLLLDSIKWMEKHNIKTNNEYYVGPSLLNIYIKRGNVYPVKTEVKFDLGNEQGIKSFRKFLKEIKDD